MIMYVCKDCKAAFEEPHTRNVYETHEYWGAPATETFVIETCPECGSEYIEERNACKSCGMPTEDRAKEYCPDCHKDLALELERLQARYRLNSRELEDFIAEHLGW